MKEHGMDEDIILTVMEISISIRRPNSIIQPELLTSARARGDVDLDQILGVNGRAAHASMHASYVQVLAALKLGIPHPLIKFWA